MINWKKSTRCITCTKLKKDLENKLKKEELDKIKVYASKYSDGTNDKPCYCNLHKIDGMELKKNKEMCKILGCTTSPSYNYENEPPQYCKIHGDEINRENKLKNINKIMVNVKTARCAEKGCNSIGPSFNIIGSKIGKYCGIHKKIGMIDVAHKKCIDCNLNLPCWNTSDKTKPEYCGDCKSCDMIDVVHKKCSETGCNTLPSFNYENEKSPLYCLKHIKIGMINVISKICESEDCNIQAYYNYKGLSPIYCFQHKLNEDMIDVKSKKCITCKELNVDIPKRAVYNFSTEKIPKYCRDHILNEEMIDLNCKKCITCKIGRASYNYPNGEEALYCNNIKCGYSKGMINFLSKKCKTENCITVVHNKYNGYCILCYRYLFPEKPISKNFRTKEKVITDYIKEKFSEIEWSFDKSIFGGTSNRRPDVFVKFKKHALIIEIDENQHVKYDCICENKRIMQISQDLMHVPIIFIRFNPDDFIDIDNNKIKSPWEISKKNGQLKIVNKQELKKRLKNLKNQIKYWIKNKTDKTVEIIQLYYNEN
jgi:hypothetical protein